MPRLAKVRLGTPVKLLKRPLTFSYWPTYEGERRDGLQSTIFVTNPWSLIKERVAQKLTGDSLKEALAYVDQSHGFYDAVEAAHVGASNPLLMYYCFMNLAKAYVLASGSRTSLVRAGHGLSEKLRSPASGTVAKELVDAYLKAHPSPASGGRLQVFHEFLKSMNSVGLTAQIELDLPKLIPQILVGHRLWADATVSYERFVSLARIDIVENKSDKTIWLRFLLYKDDLSRLGVTIKRLRVESGIGSKCSQVEWNEDIARRELLCLEQRDPVEYTARPSDEIKSLISPFREHLWTVVTSIPPYRKYYFYLAPPAERDQLLPQLISIYAVIYYLGSITRYRPQDFSRVLSGDFGGVANEILSSQLNQFLYLMASEFARRDVVKPAIV